MDGIGIEELVICYGLNVFIVKLIVGICGCDVFKIEVFKDFGFLKFKLYD